MASFMLWPLESGSDPYAQGGFLPWQVLTYGFMHGGFVHLAFNMLALVMFGAPLEHTWGEKRFLTYYVACIVGAAVFQLAVGWWTMAQGGEAYPTVGASGGIFGTGLGRSKLKWSWIPEVENDFIFAIIGEELGLIGALTIIGVYLALAAAFMKLVRASTDPFVRFASTGIMLWVVVQAMVNIGVVLGVFPVLGVPLPLMSAGGSSMIAILAAIGIVLAFEREQHAESNERGGLQATPRLKSVK